ncbi:metallophosphoesterase [Pseudoalteromonas sp. 31A1]|uniref:metallophosphoesterase family protein n=1 Tax=Pseudoalteromonas sp. 31A1 TaxID=2686351 RepID=UPI0013FDA29F|nr:metallophosphoesterase [Pseudoalteromonas sp. 31A1]
MVSLALRFRDLVTPPDGTIELHQEIINKIGYVYWGWWAKAGEKCPSKFNELQEQLSDGDQDVFLFDSGQSKLYKATIVDVAYNNSKYGMNCPSIDATPDYYRARTFKAWFKFTQIIEITQDSINSQLNSFSYESDNFGLFKESEPFQDFFDKQVSSLEELRHQDRTIWFLKSFDADKHETHEIVLYNSSNVDPSVFPKNYSKLYSSKVHWVSDLHFSDSPNRHAFDDELEAKPLTYLIEDKFKDELHSLIVSGDMTWSATNTEFDKTKEFYGYLCSNTGLSFDKIGFCPGNHDIAFDGQLDDLQTGALDKFHKIQRGSTEPVILSYEEKSSLKAIETSSINNENYKIHFEQVTSVKPNSFLSMGKKLLVNGQRALDICFLNSNTLEQYKSLFQGTGFIGENQRTDALSKMGWKQPKAYGALRVVVLHHNLLPVEYSKVPYLGAQMGSVVYDSQATLKWCYEHQVDVILHGHTHQRSAIKIQDKLVKDSKGIWLVGLGSTGVHQSHLVHSHLNQLAELDFSKEYISIQFFKILHNTIEVDGDPLILD